MSSRIAWVGLALALLATVMTTQAMRVSAGHRGAETTAVSIAPEEITRNAGELPVTKIDMPF